MKNSTNSTNLPLGERDRLRAKQAAKMADASVGTIYAWMKEEPRPFETWVVKRRGFERGIRYIDKASFERFLKSQRDGCNLSNEVTA
jgi:hypothetical protein